MNLNELKPRLEAYVKFAKQFPAAYRPGIVSHLLAWESREFRPAAVTATPDRGARPVASDVAVTSEPATKGDAVVPSISRSTFDPVTVWNAMASDLNLPEADVRRAIHFDGNNRPEVRLRIEEDVIARKQLAYSIIYLYATEYTGREGANSKELRDLCEQKRAFNSPNFTRNYKASPWVKGYGSPGKRDQDWLLTQAGRVEAKVLLRRLLGGEANKDAEIEAQGDTDPSTAGEVAAD